MKYYKYTYSEKEQKFNVKEMDEESALQFLGAYYKDTECFRGKMFRVKTMFGYVETRSENGLCPAPGFYGVCG